MALDEQIHSVPRFSDSLIFIGFFRWIGFKTLRESLFFRNVSMWQFWYVLFIRAMAILTEIFAYPLRCIYRHKAGKLGGGGFIMTLLSGWMIILFNNESSLKGYWMYFSRSIEVAYRLIFTSEYSQITSDEILSSLWQPQSGALTIFLCCFLIAALTHIITRMCGYRNSNSWSKGRSIFYDLSKKYIRVSHSFCQILLEAAVTVSVAFIFHRYLGDFRVALYLWIASFALFAQELADYSAKIPYQK